MKKYVKNSAGKATVTLYIDDVFEHIYRKDSTGTLEAEKNIIYIKDGRSQLARQRIDAAPRRRTGRAQHFIAAHCISRPPGAPATA